MRSTVRRSVDIHPDQQPGPGDPPPPGRRSGRRARPAEQLSPKGKRARAEIERVAAELFATQGYFRTTVRDIASAAGRSSAAFYRYFDNKEQVLLALCDRFMDEVLARSQPSPLPSAPAGGREFFLAATQGFWDVYKHNLGVMVAVFQLATVDERFAERQSRIRQAAMSVIEETVRQAKARGYGRGDCRDLDTATTAGALAVMFEHFAFVSLGQTGSGSAAVDEDKAVGTLASIWYRSLYGRPVPQAPE